MLLRPVMLCCLPAGVIHRLGRLHLHPHHLMEYVSHQRQSLGRLLYGDKCVYRLLMRKRCLCYEPTRGKRCLCHDRLMITQRRTAGHIAVIHVKQ